MCKIHIDVCIFKNRNKVFHDEQMTINYLIIFYWKRWKYFSELDTQLCKQF